MHIWPFSNGLVLWIGIQLCKYLRAKDALHHCSNLMTLVDIWTNYYDSLTETWAFWRDSSSLSHHYFSMSFVLGPVHLLYFTQIWHKSKWIETIPSIPRTPRRLLFFEGRGPLLKQGPNFQSKQPGPLVRVLGIYRCLNMFEQCFRSKQPSTHSLILSNEYYFMAHGMFFFLLIIIFSKQSENGFFLKLLVWIFLVWDSNTHRWDPQVYTGPPYTQHPRNVDQNHWDPLLRSLMKKRGPLVG